MKNKHFVSQSGEKVTLFVVAVLFWASRWLERLDLPHPTTSEILAKAPVNRSSAFSKANKVDELEKYLIKPTGRPPKEKIEVEKTNTEEIAAKTIEYLMSHPGSVSVEHRGRYSAGFKEFAVKIFEENEDIGATRISRAINVPESTLKQWLNRKDDGQREQEDVARKENASPQPGLRVAHCETIVSEWNNWQGTFSTFCVHIRQNLGIPMGKTAISSILQSLGERIPARRAGRSPNEEALRDKFLTFFSNAQWCGDGSLVAVNIDGQRHQMNVELNVDTYSGAFVGAHVSETEDSKAVIEAFEDAKETTGEKPVAILLDNKPSNHSPEVESAIEDTLLIRSTSGRAQNKAHIEGGFGLFKPTLENIFIDTSTKASLVATILAAIVIVWGRTINHRPRKDRGNLSRVEIASQTPTPEEVELAKKNLQERKRRQDKARETTQARRDPELASLIRKEFDQLCLEDPGDHFLDALTRYSKDVVVNALAIFKAKKKNDESKKDIDARYLLGIANNIDNERYLSTLASELWQLREKAADEMSQYLQNEKKELELLFPNPDDFARNAMNKAVENDQFFRMRFWVEAVVEKVKNQNSPQATFQNLARSLAGNFKATKNGRERALRLLAEKLLPL